MRKSNAECSDEQGVRHLLDGHALEARLHALCNKTAHCPESHPFPSRLVKAQENGRQNQSELLSFLRKCFIAVPGAADNDSAAGRWGDSCNGRRWRFIPRGIKPCGKRFRKAMPSGCWYNSCELLLRLRSDPERSGLYSNSQMTRLNRGEIFSIRHGIEKGVVAMLNINFDPGEVVEAHECTAHRVGDWIIYRCEQCPEYERRYNWRTGEMKVRHSKKQCLHKGSYFPEEYENAFINTN